MKIILAFIVFSFSGMLLAQETSNQRMLRLERMVMGLEQRVLTLESIVNTPIPTPITYWACSVTNGYSGTTYMGKDASKEGAKAKAKNDCMVYSHTPSYCRVEPVCDIS